jgi:hypothetical protein
VTPEGSGGTEEHWSMTGGDAPTDTSPMSASSSPTHTTSHKPRNQLKLQRFQLNSSNMTACVGEYFLVRNFLCVSIILC